MYNVESFCQIMVLNEALFGQEEESVRMILKEVGAELDFDFRDYYLCLTGIPRKYYRTYLTVDRPLYQKIYHPLLENLKEWGEKQGFKVLHAILNFDRSKQICFLLQKNSPDCLPVECFAVEAAKGIEEEYQKIAGYASSGLANLTVLSPLLTDYRQLSQGLMELRKLGQLSFFRMEAGVFRREELAGKQINLNEVYQKTDEIETSVYETKKGTLCKTIHELFVGLLKESMSFELCEAAVYELNRILLQVTGLLLPETHAGIGIDTLVMGDYPSIEKVEAAAKSRFLEVQKLAAPRSSRAKNPLTLQAVSWLRQNYSREIGLQEAADYLEISPSYLSRVFSRDLGITLSAYLLQLRLEQAKRLLLESGEKISKIARHAGFQNPEYFGALFKKKTGLRPQEYREAYGKTL